MPVFYFIAAAALFAGGYESLDKYIKSKARQDAKHEQDLEFEILEREIDLAELRKIAREHGLDPETAVQGYKNLASGTVKSEALIRALMSGK